MIQAACLCGKISFEVEEINDLVFNCHCSRCQRAHGSAYSTQVVCHRSTLHFRVGRELLKEYINGIIVRAFCMECGSRLLNYTNNGTSYLSVSVSCVQSPKQLTPKGECYVNNKLDFVQLNQDLPHFEGMPEI